MEVREWLEEAINKSSLEEDAELYLLGRGATAEVISSWGIKTFSPPETPCPDETLAKRYGEHFEVWRDRIVFPLRSPRGVLMGMDSRHVGVKDEMRFVFPDSRWNAVWIGMPEAMSRIWNGSDVIVVEGKFDVFAMLHVADSAAVIGSGPAHLNQQHMNFLTRWVHGSIYMAYDQDDAGKLGTKKALYQLQKLGKKVFEVKYGKAGDDPGTIWERGGKEALRQTFSKFVNKSTTQRGPHGYLESRQ